MKHMHIKRSAFAPSGGGAPSTNKGVAFIEDFEKE
jgi:hypothetical protein